jgi:hypothetical protein
MVPEHNHHQHYALDYLLGQQPPTIFKIVHPSERPRFWQRARFWLMLLMLVNIVNGSLCAWGAVNTSVWFYAYFLAVTFLNVAAYMWVALRLR